MPSVRRIDHLAADRPGAHRCDRLGDLGPGGQRFAIVPMADRQVYCTATGTATATSPAGVRYPDDAAELQRRFGRWHDPIPQITAGLTPGQVLHHNVFDLVDQPAAFHHGRVALVGAAAHAMTPELGQGGCLAVEDAVTLSALVETAAVHDVPIALARYAAARRPRTSRPRPPLPPNRPGHPGPRTGGDSGRPQPSVDQPRVGRLPYPGGTGSPGRAGQSHHPWGAQVSDASTAHDSIDSTRPAHPVLDISVAHPARVYDYWLGGKDHYAPDREAAEQVIAANPGIVPGVRSNRAFLVRSVRHLVTEAGVRQILDIGTGLPSANNVHEVAQATAPETRVVYVDNDPIVLVHAHALLTGDHDTVSYLDADLRDPTAILQQARHTLDFSRPIAVMLLMTLQFIADHEDPYGIVATLLEDLPSGSYLVISHPARDDEVGIANAATARYNESVATRMTRRTFDEISSFFSGLELVPPGVVALREWRPDVAVQSSTVAVSPAYCGMGLKP
jgi:hypothetical protein